jgi:hypothetical protein
MVGFPTLGSTLYRRKLQTLAHTIMEDFEEDFKLLRL